MADKTWKADERKVARMFGAERNRLSGSSGRDCDSCSDSNHARLYIEAKRKKRHTVNMGGRLHGPKCIRLQAA